MEINLNDLAKKYTEVEGGKISLPIGQVKEVLKVFLTDLAQMDVETVTKLITKAKKRYNK